MSSSDCSQHEEDTPRLRPKDSYICSVDDLESEGTFSLLSSKDYRECAYPREEVKTPPTAPQTPSSLETGKHSLKESAWKGLGAADVLHTCPFEANFTLSSASVQGSGPVDKAGKDNLTPVAKQPEAESDQNLVTTGDQYLSVLSSKQDEQSSDAPYIHSGSTTKTRDIHDLSDSRFEGNNIASNCPPTQCVNATLQTGSNNATTNSALYLSPVSKNDLTPLVLRSKSSNNHCQTVGKTCFVATNHDRDASEASEAAIKCLGEAPRNELTEYATDNHASGGGGRGQTDVFNTSHCSDTCVRNYLERRASFERNCFLRYEAYLEKAKEKIRRVGGSLEGRRLMRSEYEDTEEGRSPLKATTPGRRQKRGGGYYSSRVDPSHSSSGEDGGTRGAGEGGDHPVSGAEVDVGIQDGSPRKIKSGPQRSFPYRHFHIHHMLPEPENKVGLLTHPTPAQFNKYPKARGVWFDPHRNLVRTCWKENGKARTMGFPVNKFGLEEARTLAVEYHFYKCPSDPLPEDLCTLVPRKPPHEYGWC